MNFYKRTKKHLYKYSIGYVGSLLFIYISVKQSQIKIVFYTKNLNSKINKFYWNLQQRTKLLVYGAIYDTGTYL